MKKLDIQFAYTILYVKDVAKTLKFYQNAFGFEEKMLTPEKDYGEVVSGATTLAFASLELGNSTFKKGFKESKLEEQPFGVELAFSTSNVDELMKQSIASGAVLLEAVELKPWGQRVGYLRDINGFIIEVCTAVE